MGGNVAVVFHEEKQDVAFHIQAEQCVAEVFEKNYQKLGSSLNKPVPKDLDIQKMMENTLTEAGFADKRTRKMCIKQFLALLLAFNKAGIHFHS